ncbi:AB hydrolase superfamily protein YdjP [Arthrobacter ulcerisalmonis]|uniref:AB hydrolase superfamily protein YdjP n=1 Tax=Arthrobacter ulcerisalmonis TaxID=2483813 RepID=A0A3P5X4T2_9MICC|nr:alpha/beta hydrolase [Arthrobacter ulcerisalmonis]VDC25486.1 AB hydrolase superfamily protein YdjP [Arthrobacter ulcerisalmonis]
MATPPFAAPDSAATWFAAYGSGEAVVALHPGGIDARSLDATVLPLAEQLRVYTLERRGHGRTPDVAGPISYELMAQDMIAFIESQVGEPVHLLGCSDGSVVALTLALLRPDLVRRLVLVAGVFHREGWTRNPEVSDDGGGTDDGPATDSGAATDDPLPEFFREAYAELSPDGGDHFDVVMAKLDQMHATEPQFTTADLAGIKARTLVMIGDDDEVSLEHAIAMYRGLPTAELAVVPGTSHGLLVEKPDLCNRLILAFLTQDAPPTFAPIRRARAAAGGKP